MLSPVFWVKTEPTVKPLLKSSRKDSDWPGMGQVTSPEKLPESLGRGPVTAQLGTPACGEGGRAPALDHGTNWNPQTSEFKRSENLA